MGIAFNRWLSKRSTLRLLREVLEATDTCSGTRARRSITARTSLRCSSTRATVRDGVRKTDDLKVLPAHSNELDSPKNSHATSRPGAFQERALKALWMQVNDVSGPQVAKVAINRGEYHRNFKLWIELLNERHRLDGVAGVLEVWKTMRFRQVNLPTTGEDADILWREFLHAAITEHPEDIRKEYLDSVLQHAKDLYLRDGSLYTNLYHCLIGRCFRMNPVKVRELHDKFVNAFGLKNVRLHGLVDDCIVLVNKDQSSKPVQYFRGIYKLTGQRNLYDHYVPKLLERCNLAAALQWHRMFISRGDGPSPEISNLPEVQWLFEQDGGVNVPPSHERGTQMPTSTQDESRPHVPPLTRASMSQLVGEAHGIQQKQVSDNFVAKLFATRAFSLAFIMNGLSFFAVERLGPLAVRELALRSLNLQQFQQNYDELQRLGVGIDASMFGRLLQKIMQDRNSRLFRALLESDQHPESFDDYDVQEQLLPGFLDNSDTANAHITLTALSLAGKVKDSRGWNRLLQHQIKRKEWDSVARTMQHIQTSQLRLSRRSLTFMHNYLLPPRQPGQYPVAMSTEGLGSLPLQFTTKAYIYAATHGTFVNEKLWIENIKRFGMCHHWDELEKLVRWLAWWYKRNDHPSQVRRHGQVYILPSILDSIFSRQMKEAIVAWGFQDATIRHLLRPLDLEEKQLIESRRRDRRKKRLGSDIPCEQWAKGVGLLRDLKDEGVHTEATCIERALTVRLWSVFGPVDSKRAVNEGANTENELSLAHFIRHANEIWDEKVYDIEPVLLEDDDDSNHAELFVAVFGTPSRANRGKRNYVKVAALEQLVSSELGEGFERRIIAGPPMKRNSRSRNNEQTGTGYKPFR